MDALMAAVQRGSATEDDSNGYALNSDAELHRIQLHIRAYALDRGPELERVLRDAANPKQRQVSAALLGYAKRSPSQVQGLSVVSFGENAGPHNLVLRSDDNRLVVTDYFLNEDAEGIIRFEGDHKVHVLKVTRDTLTEDKRFKLDFNTAFKTGPAPPHGIAMK
jgi:hypothetical protein